MEVAGLAKGAMLSSYGEVRLEMKRGLSGLATIACTAPLVGMFGTVIGIFDAFKGCGASRWVCLAATIEGICEALVTTALGLLVAVPATWCYNYLSSRMELFEVEMDLASLELVSYLVLHHGRQEKVRPS